MLFRQFVDPDLGCASYLIGSEQAGEAIVVDPAYAIEQYVDEAERHSLRIVRAVETHNHADHVAGHGRLAIEHGVPISIHPLAAPDYDFEPIVDDDVLRVGEVTVLVLHTPGHRPEHCALLVDERLLLTGDSLFVGDAARPDLAVRAAEGAGGLFHSLRRLEELPDDVVVYPGHVAGSLCGAALSSDPSSTIGRERRSNAALRIAAVDDFVAEALSKNAPRPPNMDVIVAPNRGPFVPARPDLLPAGELQGATVLDVRDAEESAGGHLPGALNVPLSGGSFSTKAAFILGDGRVVIHASSETQAQEAARGLNAVGELETLVAQDAVMLLDVREADERDEGYIAGSRHIPYRLLPAVSESLANRTVVTICSTGARAGIAASLLAAQGVDARPVLNGGVEDWEHRGGRTIEFRRCGS